MADRICENCMSRVPANADKCPRCGIRFENSNPGGALPNGWVLGDRYTVGRYISIDGEGVSYSAIDGNTLQRVIIKEFMPVTLCATRDAHGMIVSKPGCEVLFKTTKMDFADLYADLMRMGLVEGLVQVLDVLEANNTAYAVLEKVEGPTLAEYLTKMDKPLEPARALAILRPVMLGIEAMHASNLIHRGVSPDNIILESGGTAKLCGFATLALRQMGSELKPKLYPGYSAPEQYAASEFEGQYTDVYAFSAVVYRMVTGETPVSADERRLQDTMQPARSLIKETPGYLSSALSRAMRVASAERTQTMHELRLALSGENTGSRSGGKAKSGEGFLGLSRQQIIIGASALGAVVVLLLIVLLISIFGGGGKDSSSSSSSSSTSASSSVSADLTIPNFAGMLYADIVKSGSYSSFVFDTPEEQYSNDVGAGKVISQTPAAGTVWDEKTPIRFVVSKGPEEAEMPDLTGKSLDEASAILTAMNFKFDQVTLTNNGEYTENEIVRTNPAAGTKLTVGSNQTQVTLYIAGKAATATMPNLIGKTRAEAIAELNKLNIKYTENTISNDGTAVAGTISGTEPGSGAEVGQGTSVRLDIFDKYLMPNLQTYIGQPQMNLQDYLNARAASFVYSINYVETNDPAQDGIIQAVGQPDVNSEVSPGTSITISVYSYTEPPPPVSSSSTPEPPPDPDPDPNTSTPSEPEDDGDE